MLIEPFNESMLSVEEQKDNRHEAEQEQHEVVIMACTMDAHRANLKLPPMTSSMDGHRANMEIHEKIKVQATT